MVIGEISPRSGYAPERNVIVGNTFLLTARRRQLLLRCGIDPTYRVD